MSCCDRKLTTAFLEINAKIEKNQRDSSQLIDNIRSDFKGETVLVRQEICDGRSLTLRLMLLLIAVLLATLLGLDGRDFEYLLA